MDRAELTGALIDSSPDGLLLVGADGIIALANPVAGKLFGKTQEEFIGSSIDELVPQEFRHSHSQRRADFAVVPSSRPMDTGLQLFAQHSSGEMFPVEISLSPCTIEGVLYTIATIRDVSERQESATRMAMLQDRERIARDLHDMVIQRLFAAGMSLQAVQGAARPQLVADRISDSVLDAFLREDPKSRVACETLVTKGLVLVAGEVSSQAEYVNIREVVRRAVTDFLVIRHEEVNRARQLETVFDDLPRDLEHRGDARFIVQMARFDVAVAQNLRARVP